MIDSLSPKKNVDILPNGSTTIATVGSATSAGVTIILPGQSIPTLKRYKMLVTGQSLTAGDLVLCIKDSGTWVVLGKVAASN